MKRNLLLFLTLLFVLPLAAQQRTSTLKGTVLNQTDEKPLEGANVVVDSVYRTTTDRQGQFSLSGIPRGESEVRISFLGFEEVVRKVKFELPVVNLGAVRLNEEGFTLDEVIVQGQAPIAVQLGDTTQFNAAAFKTNPDADAGDLISKIPGAEVSTGSVTIQGEAVKRAYVNGKLFFGDDVMTAMNNLPADLIESVQMFDEMTDEAKFTGFDDGNRQRALNIVTKRKFNRTTNARVEAGYGVELDKDPDGNYQGRYLVTGDVTTIGEKHTWSMNGTANNMNRANRGAGYAGGGGGGMRGGGLRTINSIGLNYSGQWNPKLKFNTEYSFNDNRSTSDRWSKQTTSTLDGSRFRQDSTYQRSVDDSHFSRIRVEYEGAKDRIFFNTEGTYGQTDTWNHKFSDIRLNNDFLSNTLERNNSLQDSYDLNGRLIWTHLLGEKKGRAISLNGGGSYEKNKTDSSRETEEFDQAGDEIVSGYRMIDTGNDNWSYNFSGEIGYTEPLNERSLLRLSYRLSYEDSRTEKIAVDQVSGEIVPAQSSTFSRNYVDQRGSLRYAYNNENLRGSAGMTLRFSDRVENEIYPVISDKNKTFSSWEPFATARYMLGRSKFFVFRYNGSSRLPSLEQLQYVITENSATNLSTGNPNLKQSYSHGFNLIYNTSNTEKSTNFFTSLNASLTQNSIANKTTYFNEPDVLVDQNGNVTEVQAGTELRSPVNLNGAASIRSVLGYGFTFFPLRTNISLSGEYGYTRTPGYENVRLDDGTSTELLNYSNVHSTGFRVTFVSNISENVDFNISSRTGLSFGHNNREELSGNEKKTWTESVSARVNIIFLRSITWNNDFSWNYNHTNTKAEFGGGTTNYYMWNMGIGYKFLARKNAEFRITMYDLLNQSSKRTSINYDTNSMTTSWNRSMGRYVMATLRYRFNSLNRQGNSSQNADPDERRMRPGYGMPPGGMPGGGMRSGGGGRGGAF